MKKYGIQLTMAMCAAVALTSCGDRQPGDATGAKVLRNLLEGNGVAGKLVSFKKVQGREMKNGEVDAFELMYEAEIQFPEGLDAKCADEKERGKCAYLGLDVDQNFAKNEVLTSEGTLHFLKTEKGWMGEDKKAY